MFLFMPVQTYLFKRDRLRRGHNRPEARFLTSLVTVWLFPISLFWFAFTSNGDTSFWSPVVAGGVLGFADPLLYLSMLSYITGEFPRVLLENARKFQAFADLSSDRCVSKCCRIGNCSIPYSFIYLSSCICAHW